MARSVRNAHPLLVARFTLLFNCSTALAEIVPRARNRLSIKLRCSRNMRTTRFSGSRCGRMLRVHH
jgi:hypothetical protein